MALLVVLFLICLFAPIGIGIAVYRRGAPAGNGQSAAASRWSALTERFGTPAGAAVALVVGIAVTVAVGLAVGFVAKALQSSVDQPVFHWVIARVPTTSKSEFTTLNNKLTVIGNNGTVELVFLFAALLLAGAYGRRRWWVPVAVLLVGYFAEHYLQDFLGKVVHRGHPPTTLGTYPSGGVARIIADYGLILLLVILCNPRLTRAWRVGLWTGIATTASVEGFTRVYLSKHWFTDVVGAYFFGAVFLLAVGTAASLFVAALDAAPRSDGQADGGRTTLTMSPRPAVTAESAVTGP